MLRSAVAGRIATVMPAFEIERTEGQVVLHVPVGAGGLPAPSLEVAPGVGSCCPTAPSTDSLLGHGPVRTW